MSTAGNSRRLIVLVALAAASSLPVGVGNAGTSRLESSGVLFAGGGAAGLRGVTDVAFSPDSRHVYAVSPRDDSLVVLSYDSATASLQHIETHVDGNAGGAPLAAAASVTASPDGNHVYVRVQEALRPDGSGTTSAISIFDRDPASGRLSFSSALYGHVDLAMRAPHVFEISADGSTVYAVTSGGSVTEAASLLVFARDPSTGRWTLRQELVDGADSPAGTFGTAGAILQPADGRHIYLTSSDGRRGLAAMRLLPDRTVEFVDVHEYGDGDNGAIALAPDGRRFYAAEPASRDLQIIRYDRDSDTGALVESGRFPTSARHAGHLAIDPSGGTLYLFTSYFAATLAVDPSDGGLSEEETFDDATPGFEVLRFGPVPFAAPDGSGIVASVNGLDSVAAFRRDPDTGLLTPGTGIRDHAGGVALDSIDAVAMSPDGLNLYAVSGWRIDSLVTFARDPADGSLEFVESQLWPFSAPAGLMLPKDVRVSPDDRHVYVLAQDDYSSFSLSVRAHVLVFRRAPATGRLEFQSRLSLPIGGAGIERRELEMTPNGRFLYVYENGARSIPVVRRDGVTGDLEFIEEFDADGRILSFDDLAVSPDGRHLYVAGDTLESASGYRAIHALAIDAETGALEIESASPFGTFDGTRRRHSRDVTVSGDGRHVYSWGAVGMEVAVRDEADGSAVPLAGYAEAEDRNQGLYSVRASSVSESGENLYVVNFYGVASYRRIAANGRLGFAEIVKAGDVPGALENYAGNTLSRIRDLALSPDGRHLYVALQGASRIATYRILPTDCPVAPVAGCRAPAAARKAKFGIDDDVDDKKDKLRFKWRRGAIDDIGEFGDLDVGGSWLTCVYESESGLPALVWSGAAVGGATRCGSQRAKLPRPCWRSSSSKVRYRDQASTPDGFESIELRAGSVDRASIQVRTRGFMVDPPATPLSGNVTVQTISTETGACWGATFSRPRTNRPGSYSAKSD